MEGEEMKFPEECEILRLYNDQLPLCYVNPIEKCPHFEECSDYLATKKKEKK
jgi:hypothetical protein